MPRPVPGSLCWVDRGTRDPVAAARFYTGLFGWQVDEPGNLGYRLCRLGGRLGAGLADHPDSASCPGGRRMSPWRTSRTPPGGSRFWAAR